MSQATSTSNAGPVVFGSDGKSNLWVWGIVAAVAVVLYYISKRVRKAAA